MSEYRPPTGPAADERVLTGGGNAHFILWYKRREDRLDPHIGAPAPKQHSIFCAGALIGACGTGRFIQVGEPIMDRSWSRGIAVEAKLPFTIVRLPEMAGRSSIKSFSVVSELREVMSTLRLAANLLSPGPPVPSGLPEAEQ